MKTHPRYAEWLRYVFDRPPAVETWYFDIDLVPFDAPKIEIVELVACTMENCERDLAGYSDQQLRDGLCFIFDGGGFGSDVVFALMDDEVPVPLRLRAISSLKLLYRSIFTRRCAPILGHANEAGGNPLNYICYMLWDISPLSYWKRSKDHQVFYSAICDVMEDALNSENPACIESALHGLGHICSSYNDRVTKVIDAFLRRGVVRVSALRTYAQNARSGNVQ